MKLRMRFTVALVLAGLIAASCGGGDDLDCDLGNEITADLDAIEGSEAPTVEDLEAIRDKVNDFDAPEEIADDVETFKDSLDVFIEELGSGAPDVDALQAAGEAAQAPGERIEAYLADNC